MRAHSYRALRSKISARPGFAIRWSQLALRNIQTSCFVISLTFFACFKFITCNLILKLKSWYKILYHKKIYKFELQHFLIICIFVFLIQNITIENLQFNFLTRICGDLVHPLSENYFFHSRKEVGPVVHPTLYKR